MKWFRRHQFSKMLKKMEKDLKINAKDISILSDYELQKYFQQLKRLEQNK